MEARASVLKAAFDLAHNVFNGVVADLQPEHAAFHVPGGNVPSAAAMIAHVLYGEDMMVSQASGGAMVLDDDLCRRTGILRPQPSMSPDWLTLDFHLGGLKDYATVVFERTSEFLESADASAMTDA